MEKKSKSRTRPILIGSLVAIALLMLVSVTAGMAGHGDRRSSCQQSGVYFRDGLCGKAFSVPGWFFQGTDLTDEQQEKIGPILENLAASMQKYKREDEELRDRFRKSLESDRINAGELSKIRSAYVELFDQASKQMVDATLELSAVLTPQQRKQFMEVSLETGCRR